MRKEYMAVAAFAFFCALLAVFACQPAGDQAEERPSLMLAVAPVRTATDNQADTTPSMNTLLDSLRPEAPSMPTAIPQPEKEFVPSVIQPNPAGPAPVQTGLDKVSHKPQRIRALVTAYCPCSRCCGKFANGRTSTGTSAWKPGLASDPTSIPYGSVVEIPGYGTAKVDDTGIAMRRSWRNNGMVHFDVRFSYHHQARKWGTRILTVTVTPPASEASR